MYSSKSVVNLIPTTTFFLANSYSEYEAIKLHSILGEQIASIER